MSRRLFHLLLALSVAFVFTGRMEAAATHCRGVAAAMASQTSKMADMPGMNDCHGADHKVPGPMGEPCECLVLLTADCPLITAASASTRIEPFFWDRPQPETFASRVPVLELPPPRS